MSVVTGLIYAAISAFFNGSYIVPFKTKKVVDLNLDPIVFQLYVTVGVFLSSFIVIPFFPYNKTIADSSDAGTEFEFSPLAAAGGAMFVVSVVASFSAVQLIGLSVAQGVWSGVALLVSFLWGVVGFGEEPLDWYMTAGGIMVLAIGVVCVATCNQLADLLYPGKGLLGEGFSSSSIYGGDDELRGVSFGIDAGGDLSRSLTASGAGGSGRPFSGVVPPSMALARPPSTDSKSGVELESWRRLSGLSDGAIQRIQWATGRFSPAVSCTMCSPPILFVVLCSCLCAVGLMWAVLVGVTGGSVLAPLHYVPSSQQGFVFLPSFGMGAMVASPIMLLLHRIWHGELPDFQLKKTFWVGVLSGMLCCA